MTGEQATTLLQKFYGGQTTLAEERELETFLLSSDCPASMHADREVMRAISEARTAAAVPPTLSRRIKANLHRARTHRRNVVRRITLGVASAACLTVVFVVGMGQQQQPSVYADTCATPEQAARELNATLSMLSADLAEGMNAERISDGPMP